MADSLGRGLESLIPDKEVEEAKEDVNHPEENLKPAKNQTSTDDYSSKESVVLSREPKKGESVFWIEIEKIEPNPYQPRREFSDDALKELATSIRDYGILQPIVVTKREIETPNGLDVRYQLIAGERRWRAAQLAGMREIPAIVRRGISGDQMRLELALIENVQREDLNVLEKALAFKQLMDEFHLVQREIAGRIGKSREMVANTMRLLTLPQEILSGLRNGKITEGHARAILMAGDEVEKRFAVYNSVLTERLTVREAENKARQVSGKLLVPRKRPSQTQDPELRDWQKKLQDHLGTRVQLQKMGDHGKIVVEFFSEEELRGILKKLIQEHKNQDRFNNPPQEQNFTV